MVTECLHNAVKCLLLLSSVQVDKFRRGPCTMTAMLFYKCCCYYGLVLLFGAVFAHECDSTTIQGKLFSTY